MPEHAHKAFIPVQQHFAPPHAYVQSTLLSLDASHAVVRIAGSTEQLTIPFSFCLYALGGKLPAPVDLSDADGSKAGGIARLRALADKVASLPRVARSSFAAAARSASSSRPTSKSCTRTRTSRCSTADRSCCRTSTCRCTTTVRLARLRNSCARLPADPGDTQRTQSSSASRSSASGPSWASAPSSRPRASRGSTRRQRSSARPPAPRSPATSSCVSLLISRQMAT